MLVFSFFRVLTGRLDVFVWVRRSLGWVYVNLYEEFFFVWVCFRESGEVWVRFGYGFFSCRDESYV